MRMKRQLVFWPIFLLSALAPYLVVLALRPTIQEIESSGSIKGGSLVTGSGNSVEIHLMIGDVFAPRRTRRDIGFDLVGVTCYFDPIEVDGQNVLVTNPLLNSALYHSSRDTSEFHYFVHNLFVSLEQSREVVACFLTRSGNDNPCAGDKITPFVWAAFDRSQMFRDQGVKYLAALPLFDPTLFLNRMSEKELRSRLALNVETAVRRLIGYSMDNLQPTVRSVGLAALGSTSHRGGDSQAFLRFDQGFLRALAGVKASKTPESLDRLYFVAFSQHQGVFREDALAGLQSVSEYLILSVILSPPGALFAGTIYSVLWLMLSFLLYQQANRIWTRDNRWEFLSKLLGPNALLVALSWGTVSALAALLHPEDYRAIFWVNAALIAIGTILLSHVSKRRLQKTKRYRPKI